MIAAAGPTVSQHRRPPSDTIADAAVHVWAIGIEDHRPHLPHAAALLDPAERARAARFVFERDRTAFTVAHAVMRRILAGYLGCAPRDIRFATGRFGKPALAGCLGASGLQFNLSGSADLALLAVARGAVGIDVERVRAVQDLPGLGGLVFSPREQAVMARCPRAERLDLFHRAWTLKEAYLKAIGEGLARAPSLIDCATLLDGLPGAIHDADDPASATRWTTQQWRPAPGYHAALVAEAPLNDMVFIHGAAALQW